MRAGTEGTIQLPPKPTHHHPKKSTVFKPGEHRQRHLHKQLHIAEGLNCLLLTNSKAWLTTCLPPTHPRTMWSGKQPSATSAPQHRHGFQPHSPEGLVPSARRVLLRLSHISTTELTGELPHANQQDYFKIIYINATCNTSAHSSLKRITWSVQLKQPFEFHESWINLCCCGSLSVNIL